MKEKLGDLEIKTIFKINGITYRKGASGNGIYTICYPKYGGQFQNKMGVEIQNETKVTVYSG